MNEGLTALTDKVFDQIATHIDMGAMTQLVIVKLAYQIVDTIASDPAHMDTLASQVLNVWTSRLESEIGLNGTAEPMKEDEPIDYAVTKELSCVERFIDGVCNVHYKESASLMDLWKRFTLWLDNIGDTYPDAVRDAPKGKIKFSNELRRLGYKRFAGSNDRIYFKGIGLNRV